MDRGVTRLLRAGSLLPFLLWAAAELPAEVDWMAFLRAGFMTSVGLFVYETVPEAFRVKLSVEPKADLAGAARRADGGSRKGERAAPAPGNRRERRPGRPAGAHGCLE
jgi:hypothetical protein